MCSVPCVPLELVVSYIILPHLCRQPDSEWDVLQSVNTAHHHWANYILSAYKV